MLNYIKFANISAGSRNTAAAPCAPIYAKPYSSARDIGELLRLDCSQKQYIDEPSPQFHHRRVKAGELIYRLGESFKSLYVVRFGFLKIVLRNAEGDEQVISFPMKGSLLGFEGIYRNRYGTEAIALSDCELIVIPFNQLLGGRHSCRELEQMIYVAISREFLDEHARVSLSSTVKSEARVARFLVELSKRYAALGYSSQEISLPMTRRDIGCYLGLTLETVSRSLSAMASMGIILVHRRNIRILKPELLHSFQSSRLPLQQRNRPIRSLSLIQPGFNKIKPPYRVGA